MVSLFLPLGCNLSNIVDLFAGLHELPSANTRTLLKLASSVRALLKHYVKWIFWLFRRLQFILGDPRAASGSGKKSKRAREKNSGEEKLDFLPPPLTAPGSPRMIGIMNIVIRQRRRQMRFLSSLPCYKSQYQFSGKHLHTVFWLLELFWNNLTDGDFQFKRLLFSIYLFLRPVKNTLCSQ